MKKVIWIVIIIVVIGLIVVVLRKKASEEMTPISPDPQTEYKAEIDTSKFQQQNINAMPFEEYLKLFDKEFPSKFYITRKPEGAPGLVLDGESVKDIYIQMDNGNIISPINGNASSYKRINDEIVWLITVRFGEYGGQTDVVLNVINEVLDSIVNIYPLSSSFGEDGYFSYQNGEFINDSTFQYQRFWNDEDFKTDSLSGLHIIK